MWLELVLRALGFLYFPPRKCGRHPYRSTPGTRWASRPQFKRDPLGGPYLPPITRVLFLGLLTLTALGSLTAQALKSYAPHTLAAIPWPAGATSPEDRGMNYSKVSLRIGSSVFTLTRWETAWGTCVLEEGFSLYDVDSSQVARARTQEDTTRAWRELWRAPSYEMACAYAKNSPVGEGPPWWAAACLFVADDSLVAYGLTHDPSADARAFADSLRPRQGYYRVDRRTHSVERVAALAPGFAAPCMRDVHEQKRDRIP